jgi:hypothetical protein
MRGPCEGAIENQRSGRRSGLSIVRSRLSLDVSTQLGRAHSPNPLPRVRRIAHLGGFDPQAQQLMVEHDLG